MQIEYTPEAIYLNPDPLFSMKEAAKYLGISVSAMYELGKREKFPVVKVISDKKISKSVLDEYIKKCEQPWYLVNANTMNVEYSK
jgi:excisionase family DNA binding protein